MVKNFKISKSSPVIPATRAVRARSNVESPIEASAADSAHFRSSRERNACFRSLGQAKGYSPTVWLRPQSSPTCPSTAISNFSVQLPTGHLNPPAFARRTRRPSIGIAHVTAATERNSTMPRPDVDQLDEQIGRLRGGGTLSENEVKVLCDKVRSWNQTAAVLFA